MILKTTNTRLENIGVKHNLRINRTTKGLIHCYSKVFFFGGGGGGGCSPAVEKSTVVSQNATGMPTGNNVGSDAASSRYSLLSSNSANLQQAVFFLRERNVAAYQNLAGQCRNRNIVV